MVTKSQQDSTQKFSDVILNSVRSSNLHFSIHETPFSINITLRKKFINDNIKIQAEEPNHVIKKLKAELADVKVINEGLIQTNKELGNLCEQKDIEYNTLGKDLTMTLEKVKDELSEAL